MNKNMWYWASGILLAGGIGWYIWDRQKKKNAAAANTPGSDVPPAPVKKRTIFDRTPPAEPAPINPIGMVAYAKFDGVRINTNIGLQAAYKIAKANEWAGDVSSVANVHDKQYYILNAGRAVLAQSVYLTK